MNIYPKITALAFFTGFLFINNAFGGVIPLDIDDMILNFDKVDTIKMEIDQGLDAENTSWVLERVDFPILANKLSTLLKEKTETSLDISQPDPAYEGVLLYIKTVEGDTYTPMRVHNGQVFDSNGLLYAYDQDRSLEYWLFGTARIVEQQVLGTEVLPVYTFDQCTVLGHFIIANTLPRQCVLTNGDIFLETNRKPTQETVNILSFKDCLHHGTALINTFPRRCMTPGGKVFTEPPQIPESLSR